MLWQTKTQASGIGDTFPVKQGFILVPKRVDTLLVAWVSATFGKVFGFSLSAYFDIFEDDLWSWIDAEM